MSVVAIKSVAMKLKTRPQMVCFAVNMMFKTLNIEEISQIHKRLLKPIIERFTITIAMFIKKTIV